MERENAVGIPREKPTRQSERAHAAVMPSTTPRCPKKYHPVAKASVPAKNRQVWVPMGAIQRLNGPLESLFHLLDDDDNVGQAGGIHPRSSDLVSR